MNASLGEDRNLLADPMGSHTPVTHMCSRSVTAEWTARLRLNGGQR